MLKPKDFTAVTGTLCLVVILLAGCSPTAERPDIAVNNDQAVNSLEQTKPSSPPKNFVNAVRYLQYGRPAAARAELQTYLQFFPNNKNAKDLIGQIDTPGSDYFPPENFSVELRSGQSLSTLSRQYLGSPLKFYALAKYNNISNPDRVDIGQPIKIPLTPEAIVARRKLEVGAIAIANEDLNWLEAPASVDTPDSGANEQQSVAGPGAEPNPEKEAPVPAATAGTLAATITALLEQSDYATAYQKFELLESFGELSHDNRLLAIETLTGYGHSIANTDATVAARSFMDAGEIQLVIGDDLGALDSFSRAVELNPEDNTVMEEKQMLQQELADKYHREASSAFRRQDLDEAIDKWNTVLQIDPEHASAKAYLAQARELKSRLSEISR